MKKQFIFNVAQYIRLSREDGDKLESDSIINQKKLIDNYLNGKAEFSLYDTYIDDGFTGTNFRRPSFQRMIQDIEGGNVNCVIVKDLSRFGRDYIETGKYLERYFPEKEVRFIALTDNIDSMKQAYDMLLPIKNIFNEQYARDISKKVHASIITKQRNGEFIGAFPSYGYRKSLSDKNKLVIDEYASSVVKRIFQMYISGYGKIRIAHILNDEAVLCPTEYKKVNGDNYRNSNQLDSTSYWTYSTINRILTNPVYIGNMVQGKTCRHMHGKARYQDKEDWIIVEGTHEPVIDKDTWSKAQELLKRRTRSLDLKNNMSIFAGFLKCGECGRALCKKNSRGTLNYQCGTYIRSGSKYCTPHYTPYSVLEKIILNDLQTIIQNIDNIQGIVKKQKAESPAFKRVNETEKKRLEEELQKNMRLKKAVYEDYRENLLTKEEFISYRQDYAKKEDFLKKQIAELEKHGEETVSSLLQNPWIKRLLEMKEIEALDRDIIVEMIHSITVYENRKIQIVYNFSNELEHLFNTFYSSNENIG